jgi:hypothetical protein
MRMAAGLKTPTVAALLVLMLSPLSVASELTCMFPRDATDTLSSFLIPVLLDFSFPSLGLQGFETERWTTCTPDPTGCRSGPGPGRKLFVSDRAVALPPSRLAPRTSLPTNWTTSKCGHQGPPKLTASCFPSFPSHSFALFRFSRLMEKKVQCRAVDRGIEDRRDRFPLGRWIAVRHRSRVLRVQARFHVPVAAGRARWPRSGGLRRRWQPGHGHEPGLMADRLVQPVAPLPLRARSAAVPRAHPGPRPERLG